jgi:hypothetical protein
MKMRATRQVLAVVAVTTALCADRAVVEAAPVARTQTIELAGRLVMHLARRLRRVVAAIRPWQERLRGVLQVRRSTRMPALAFVAPRLLSPFQFRLPPPTV